MYQSDSQCGCRDGENRPGAGELLGGSIGAELGAGIPENGTDGVAVAAGGFQFRTELLGQRRRQ